MRLTTIILITAILQVSAGSYAQKITLSENNAPLIQVLSKIRSQSGYDFLFTRSILKDAKMVTIKVENKELDEVLKTIFSTQPLQYSIEDKSVVIEKKIPGFLERLADSWAAIDVRGVVTDSLGKPLPGATVKVKGGNTQVNTNAQGEFYMANVDENAVLLISYVGYERRELKAEKDLGMIRMVMANAELEEVNVASTGYQKVKPNEVTGSLVVIDNNALNQQVGTNILKRLNGMTTGVMFDTKSLSPQKKLNISIRGLSTINGPLDPLVVLDGFIYEGDINNINPNVVENITILKDAAAAAIWGARAGNGVIVMTTKKGNFNQALQVSINANVIVNSKPDLFYLPQTASGDYIDFEQFLYAKGFYNSRFSNTSRPPLSPAVEIFRKATLKQISPADSLAQINALKGIDIRDEYNKYFYTNAITQQYGLNLRGGTSNNAFSMFLGYDRNLNELHAQSDKLNMKVENVFKPMDKLQLTTSVYYTKSNNKSGRPAYNNTTIDGKRVPYLRFKDDNGNPLPVAVNIRELYTDTVGKGKLLNWKYYPTEEYKHNTTVTDLDELYARFGLDYKLFSFLSIDLSYQYQKQDIEKKQLQTLESYAARNLINLYTNLSQSATLLRNPVPIGGIKTNTDNAVESQTARAQLNINHLRNNHSIVGILGAEVRELHSFGDNNTVYGYNQDPLSFVNVDFTKTYRTSINGISRLIPGAPVQFPDIKNRFVSVYTNFAYTLNRKYIFSASARRDGSNIFGANTNDRWKPLWSAGVAWNVSNEKFYNTEILPVLRIRATYGYSGNVDLSKSALPIAGFISNNSDSGFPVARMGALNDPELRWEKVRTINAGVDFSFKGEFLKGSVDYYHKVGSDLYGLTPLDYTTFGLNNMITKNVANMEGHGVELALGSLNINRGIRWRTDLYLTFKDEKTTHYYTEEAKNVRNILGGGRIITPVIGQALYAIAAYKWAGLDAAGNPQGYLNGAKSTDYLAIAEEGMNKGLDGNIVLKGSAIATVLGSLINSFSYRNFSVAVNISFMGGYYFKKSTLSYGDLINGNGHSDYAKRWQSPGDELKTNVPSFIYPNNSNRDSFYDLAEINVLKGDHIRLQYINFEYLMKKKLFRKSGPQGLTFFFNAANLGILWRANKEGIDPEYPAVLRPLKSWSFGFRTGF
ncbi:TonB-linked SusC/RagA family outer membrane protein [Pedobacter sp. AK017]|uniref:SusC/RagA family TonB-linked outer membrane protein n=1 Tax=Pedobacter sp. AK017 TaxID=2723073 RepID=UPI001622B731|nr:SusC/RagA family TonB-linked outer membrane protein [Pedobacter sp. AK017]MBB5441316.1 TonB-linked SusC/RagA family outer membrane protein [Pedobacter sp. AK017]